MKKLLCIVTLIGLAGTQWSCTHSSVEYGRITPDYFKFRPLVPRSRKEPGGWQAVCIHARFWQHPMEASVLCKFEVGIPIANSQQGEIPLDEAKEASADMANRAAYRVLSETRPGFMTAELCLRFKQMYEAMLKEKIMGARVWTPCYSSKLKPVIFDLPGGAR